MVDGSGNFIHGHTYAGNPLSCGIADKVMEIIERENYIENCAFTRRISNEETTRIYTIIL